MHIKPGQSVTIVVSEDVMTGRIDVRNSTTYDVLSGEVILAQTDPPIRQSYLNKTVVVTYLIKEKGGSNRFGFHAKITKFIKDYELSSRQTQPALVIIPEGIETPYNLRMYYRIEPPDDSGFGMVIDGQKVNLLDISIGGARFSHNRIHVFRLRQTLKITLNIDGEEFEVMARALRIWEESERNLEFVSVQFLDLDKKLVDLLGRKIIDVERRLRFREVFG
jgi:hypothetical protein